MDNPTLVIDRARASLPLVVEHSMNSKRADRTNQNSEKWLKAKPSKSYWSNQTVANRNTSENHHLDTHPNLQRIY